MVPTLKAAGPALLSTTRVERGRGFAVRTSVLVPGDVAQQAPGADPGMFGPTVLDQISAAAAGALGRSCKDPINHRPCDEADAPIGPAKAFGVELGILPNHKSLWNLYTPIDDHVLQPRRTTDVHIR
jgi:hypothetical protein